MFGKDKLDPHYELCTTQIYSVKTLKVGIQMLEVWYNVCRSLLIFKGT